MLDIFEAHGFLERGTTGLEHYGSCPLCEDTKHFYVNEQSGQWSCKKCGENGNAWTFLSKVCSHWERRTRDEDYKKLAAHRDLPIRALKRYGLAWDAEGERWLLPVRNERGFVRDVRHWSYKTGAWYSTKGCKAHLFGLQRLSEVAAGRKPIFWLCEGEWDAIAFSEMLVRVERRGDAVLAVPGADTFKPDWAQFFAQRRVRLCYDNDDAGDRGSAKAGGVLRSLSAQVEFLCWPETLPTGHDVRDHFRPVFQGKQPAKVAFSRFHQLFRLRHRRDQSPAVATQPKRQPTGAVPTYRAVLGAFQRWLKVDPEFELGLRVSLAAALSERLPGDPLWMYLIAPPGGGKTAILAAMARASNVLLRSTVTPQSLVSGFAGSADPSLLAQAHEKVVIFKDGTEILALPQTQQEEVFSILRGAYDGHVLRTFGNNVRREYSPLHFTLLVGVTPVINTVSRATLGDRFLKLELRNGPETTAERIAAAIRSVDAASEAEEAMQTIVQDFLERSEPAPPKVPSWVGERLVWTCMVAAGLRAGVQRNVYTDELLVRPQAEVGTRLAKQLLKLMRGLAMLDGRKEISEADYQVATRVALDTGAPFHAEIVRVLLSLPPGGGLLRGEIAERVAVSSETVRRRLEDLRLLGIVDYVELAVPRQAGSKLQAGSATRSWGLQTEFREWCAKAGLAVSRKVKVRNG